MRFNAAATALAYTNGYGGGALSIGVIDAVTGLPLAVLPGGHDPRWLGPTSLLARALDGRPTEAEAGGYRCQYVGANDGDLDANNGYAAYAEDRANGVTAYAPLVPPRVYHGTFEPALSAGGTIALRDLASGNIRLERLAGCIDPQAIDPNIGPATRARWSGGTIAWDTLPFGRILGRSTPDQPTIDLSVPGHSCVMPVPLWTGSRLYVGFVVDDGLLAVALWDSLVRQDGAAWLIATSGGSAFDWDLAAIAGDPGRLRVAYLSPAGALVLTTVDVAAPPASLLPEAPEPPIDPEPPEPPIDPEPPEPPIDPEPKPPQPEPKPPQPSEAIVITFPELRNMEMRLEDTYCNHGKHPPQTYTIHVNQEGFVWRQHYWDRRAAGLDHETAIRSIESDIDKIEGRPDRWAQAPPEPGVAGPVRGPIGTDRRFFTVP
jgi:hypothetical protein